MPNDHDGSAGSFGAEELLLLADVLRSGTLSSTSGSTVGLLEQEFARASGTGHAVACSSGTMAIHAAIAAIDPEPGEEVITTPLTDIGAIAPILFQGAIPVFADVDPVTCNITAATVAERISSRTRAIVATHLFGNPAPMAAILDVAAAHGVPVIEDCAQAYHARSAGRPFGTIGAIGCFSLHQGTHMTAGEGGLVVTDDEGLAQRIRAFINKGWSADAHGPDHRFLALNGRLSELQGAVALAQLQKLGPGVARRVAMANLLTDRLMGVPGITCPRTAPDDVHTYWAYALHVDRDRVRGGPEGLAARLRDHGVPSMPRTVHTPAFEWEVISDQRTFAESRFPFSLARSEATDYAADRFCGTHTALRTLLVLPMSGRYEAHHVDHIADAIATEVQR